MKIVFDFIFIFNKNNTKYKTTVTPIDDLKWKLEFELILKRIENEQQIPLILKRFFVLS
jgi:hypothetical protein